MRRAAIPRPKNILQQQPPGLGSTHKPLTPVNRIASNRPRAIARIISVPASAKISTPAGQQPLHDDRLLSASLVAVFDDLYTTGQLRLGRAHSAIIPASDPLADLSF